MARGVAIAAILAAVLSAAGCGGSGSTGELRLVQASPSAPALDLVVDGTTQASDVLYGNATGYLNVNSGSRHVQAIPVNSTSPIFDSSISIAASDNRTVLLTGSSPKLQSVVLTDGGTAAATGKFYVRVVNVSANMGVADVYIVIAGTGISGVTPAATNVGFGQSSGYQAVATGNFEVIMTSPQTNKIRLDTGPIYSGTGQNVTLLTLDGPSSGVRFTVLQDQ